MQIIRVGVDLAKEVFHVHGVSRKEEPVWRRKLSRENWLKVVMEKLERELRWGWRLARDPITGHASSRREVFE